MTDSLAFDDKTGKAYVLKGQEWVETPVAVDDKTGKPSHAFDGKEWKSIGAPSGGSMSIPGAETAAAVGNAVNTGVNWLGTQFTKAGTGIMGAPRAVGELNQRIAEWGGEKLGAPETGKAVGRVLRHAVPGFGIGPSSEDLNKIVFGQFGVPEVNAGDNPALTLTNPFGMEGKVNLGKMADVGAQAVPSALVGGPAAAAARTIPAFTGGVTSEAAGQVTEGTPYEMPARIFGALPGAFLGAKATTPLPSNLSPEQARLVGIAKEKGIPLTVGQETGRGRGVESALSRFPTSQGRMASFADDQATAVNKDALKAVGAEGDRLDPTTMNRVIKGASDEFEAVKNSSGPVKLNTDFFRSLEKTIGGYLENTPAAAKTPSVVKRAEDFVGSSRTLTGEQYQEFRRTLNTAAQQVGDVGARRALQGMRNSLDDAMEASLPAEQAAAWREVRKNWANLKILTKAAAGGTVDSRTAGNLSPSALSTALRQRQGVDRFSSAEGGLNDTARVAAYLADTVPNSGTPQTLMTQGMVTGGPIGAGFLAGGLPGAAAGAGIAALPNVAARAMTGGQGFGWLRDYLANQALPNTRQEVARVPFTLAPNILTDQRGRR